MRPLISYDDITIPQAAQPPPPPERQPNQSATHPPAKKRKTGPNHRQGGSRNMQGGQRTQHWDDPDNQRTPMSYDDAPKPGETKAVAAEEEEEEESRELTHDEIWDDSALIDAWNSAAAEYEAFHGPGKKWKQEPVKKSPLSWYNVPPEKTKTSKGGSKASSSKPNSNTVEEAHVESEVADSAPINFDTFVPTHDPSLAAAAVATAAGSRSMMDGVLGSGAEAAMVSQDEAFSRAMAAMYWSGYWTAVYHCRRNESQSGAGGKTYAVEGDNGGVEEGEDEDEDMLPRNDETTSGWTDMLGCATTLVL